MDKIKKYFKELFSCDSNKWRKRSNDFQALAFNYRCDLIELVNNPNSKQSNSIKKAFKDLKK